MAAKKKQGEDPERDARYEAILARTKKLHARAGVRYHPPAMSQLDEAALLRRRVDALENQTKVLAGIVAFFMERMNNRLLWSLTPAQRKVLGRDR